jgi:hypothetical protein
MWKDFFEKDALSEPFEYYNSAGEFEPFEAQTAWDYYVDLEQALRDIPDYPAVYRRFLEVFMDCLNQKTAGLNLMFGGAFAKTDYLLKEYKADRKLMKKVNDTRVRLRNMRKPGADLPKWCLYDLRNLCLFVEFLYGTRIPASLREHFPTAPEQEFLPPRTGDCMRIIVTRWDEVYVYGTCPERTDGEELKVLYTHRNAPYTGYDGSYLRALLREGCQLNIVFPREHEGVVYPELIVYEPDYLVDISTVASCFKDYAESPYVHLINKISKNVATTHTLLGNFAGQLLDEEIQTCSGETRTYAESATRFWQNDPVDIITTELDKNFHGEARKQQEHIHRAITQSLPEAVHDFDIRECMVEPSFFSEMLGLQGRMDFLQQDFKLLMEQKSGKAAYVRGDDFVAPRQTETHYVQMLLYMTLIRYNYNEQYKRNGALHAFLLYSKYQKSLLGLGFAPELVFNAFRLRNRLAWMEINNTREENIRILERLTPEKLNLKHAHGVLWDRYQRVQLQEVLSPIQQASPLEKAYYFRFMAFVAQEHVLSKLGNETKEDSGFAAIWHNSLQEKLQAGNIYDCLQLVSPDDGERGAVRRVVLRFAETESNNMSNFRVGDIVILYPYAPGTEPDARRSMVLRSTIADIKADTIELVLRAPQTDSRIFLRQRGMVWAIEHDFMDSSYGALYRGLHAFLSAPRERRDLWLLQREPEVDDTRTLNGDYGDFNELSLRVKQAKDLFLIIGPPGTGKTSFGLLTTVREELTEPGSTVLLMAYTNRAVDEICSKLKEEGIDFVRLGSRHSCSQEYEENLLSNKAKGFVRSGDFRSYVQGIRVMVATTTAMSANLPLLQLRPFSLAIIDEASQILEPQLLGILSASMDGSGEPCIKKMVLIGDHKQLPAVVQQRPEVSKVNNELLQSIELTDCRLSLFERFLKRYRERPEVVYMLTKHGRMHRDIATFPNMAFYNNQLEVVPLEHQVEVLPRVVDENNGIDRLLATHRVVFLHVDRPEHSLSNKVNVVEADMIAATVLRIYEREKENFKAEETVGVIVPYRNQITTIRNKIDESGIAALHGITIDTVERYQGSQRRYIIYGFTVQRHAQLKFLTDNVFRDTDGTIVDRKLNVAMTRAMEHLVMVGNAELLSHAIVFARLLHYVRSIQGYYEIPPQKYIKGMF